MATCTSTNTNTVNVYLNEIETYLVGNSGSTISFVEENFGTAPTFTSENNLTGWTVNAYAKKTNNSGGTVYTVGTVAGAAANTNMSLSVDFSTAVAADGTGEYYVEIWAVNDVDSDKKVLLHPTISDNVKSYIKVNLIDRIQNDS